VTDPRGVTIGETMATMTIVGPRAYDAPAPWNSAWLVPKATSRSSFDASASMSLGSAGSDRMPCAT